MNRSHLHTDVYRLSLFDPRKADTDVSQFGRLSLSYDPLLLMQDFVHRVNKVARQNIVLRELLSSPFSRAIHAYLLRQLV